MSRPLTPTVPAQYADARAGRLPEPCEVREGLWSIPVPMPGARLPYSLAYALTDDGGGVHVVDPGTASDDGWDRLVAGIARLGRSVDDVASVTCTHMHPDHLGQATRLADASGAVVAVHRAEVAGMEALRSGRRGIVGSIDPAWGVPDEHRADLEAAHQVSGTAPWIDVDRELEDGDRLDIPGRRVEVVWTPGHTGGHVCLRESEEKVLLTGDHVLPVINPGLGLGGQTASNPLADYLASLDRVAVWDEDEVCPGHGYQFVGVAQRCAELAAHQRQRLDEVERALAAGVRTAWDVAGRLTWTGGWERLAGFRRASAIAQTAMMMQHVRGAQV
ncbi:Glyoxylase, beta-lactamase superfamily II [Paraoerskovia marina]|uniref:Glyoxylase, beta-lactamase superfamily II n=1 Tax=Paraoerskovia marina TaxID=545619 RepID=A0A1H1RR06_9CELL|nr:MBL fold metallo-hydrolase [Paraoerskovia marina]SDS38103.1 Glyoxylase, beta-lactamase superfamily II [Paraoerskovia marina]